MTELGRSVAAVLTLLRTAGDVRDLITLTTARRALDLSDLAAADQAALLADRVCVVEPSVEALAERLESARAVDRPLVAKFSVEPFATEFHLGNVVPLLVLDRLRRMGHEVVYVVGDVTAKLGDASGSVRGGPALADEEIARNVAAYREQLARYVDFGSIRVLHNSDWLAQVSLPRLLALAGQVPVSLLPQDGVETLAQLLYPVVKAMDSIEIGADVEVGGTYQRRNMAVCRHLMAAGGSQPEIALSTPLIDGVDGASPMSANRGNHISLQASAREVFTRITSVPHRLVGSYLRMLTEWLDVEVETASAVLSAEELRAVAAADITAALHGVDAAVYEFQNYQNELEERAGA